MYVPALESRIRTKQISFPHETGIGRLFQNKLQHRVWLYFISSLNSLMYVSVRSWGPCFTEKKPNYCWSSLLLRWSCCLREKMMNHWSDVWISSDIDMKLLLMSKCRLTQRAKIKSLHITLQDSDNTVCNKNCNFLKISWETHLTSSVVSQNCWLWYFFQKDI